MTVQAVLLRLLLLLLSPSRRLGDDTVAEDISAHQLGRLVELLTSSECEDLLSALSHPEENIFQRLNRLSLENNQLDLQKRIKRDTGRDSEAQCRTALTNWLLKHGEQTYYDRLSRALQQVGRTDIAIEMGKNINQDKTLSLMKYVEEYHQTVNAIESPLVQSEKEKPHKDAQPQARHVRNIPVRDLKWSDLELVVERAPVQPYQRRLLNGAWPLVYGVLLGFTGAFVIVIPILLFLLHISHGDHGKLIHHAGETTGPSSLLPHERYHHSSQDHKTLAEAGECGSCGNGPYKPKKVIRSLEIPGRALVI
ncbi:transmembrane and death domain protein 1-like [Esox lucius]|uniref:transmembrane and death domain protein 1-like n=1 Tax=Esox lucius TaxID=8010 RepID=UPI00147691C8|nr:transmembrane and death domain protein 1-like [Esox lucius]